MSKILFITNMEHHERGMKAAKLLAEKTNQLNDAFEQLQIKDSEIWNQRWEEKLCACEFVLVSWMGTGLCCDFLKKSSIYMQKNHI